MSYFITNNDHVCTSVLYRKDSEYLQHGWIGSRGPRKHRYIKRTGTPGNYKYIYPGDLAAIRASRNQAGATLFGNRQLGYRTRSAERTARRLQRAEDRYNRRAQRLERRSTDLGYKLRDPTIQGRKRERLEKKASRLYAKSQALAAMSKKISEAKLSVQQAAKISRLAYDRSRKIDDIPANVADAGRAYFNSLFRKRGGQAVSRRYDKMDPNKVGSSKR